MNQTSINDVVTLSNGVLMPWLGLGVWKAQGSEVTDAVKWAVEAGYRHIDTAAAYRNEPEVGAGIAQCGISRHDLFITSKVAKLGYRSAIEHCEQTLKDLGTDYLDLYLIHWPRPEEGDNYVKTWHALERLYKEGKVRAIGVANFYEEWLQVLMEQCDVAPMVNQFECHPYYQMPALQQFCREHNIQYEAYSPLGGSAILADPVIGGIAARIGRTPAQVILRYALQNGIVVIPKSVHKERIASNADIFDFVLSEEDMALIRALDKNYKITCRPPEMTFEAWQEYKAQRDA